MTKSRNIALVAVSVVVLLAVLGLRGSFITANISPIAQDFFDAELANKRLARLLEDANQEASRERERAERLQYAAESRIKELEGSVRSLQAQREVDAESVEQGLKSRAALADLERQAGELRSEVSSLRRRLHELDPPADADNAPGRVHWWKELVAQRASLSSIKSRLGACAFTLKWSLLDTNRRALGVGDKWWEGGRWGDETWESEIFPRFRTGRNVIPSGLRVIFTSVKPRYVEELMKAVHPTELNMYLWSIGNEQYAVVITASGTVSVEKRAYGTVVTENEQREEVVGYTALARSAFLPRNN